MAADDNVIRLKNIKSLARIIADITLQGGGSAVIPHDADFALYVPDSTSIIVTGKQQPALSLGGWSIADTVYTAAISYDGDGTLSTDVGTITNGTLTVNDADGTFSGVISASSGNHFAASKLYFDFDATTIAGESVTVTVAADPKPVPALSIGGWSVADTVYSAVVSYSGDGALSVNNGTITNGTLTVSDADGTFNGVITAAEGTNFAPAKLYFDFDATVQTVGGGGGKPIPVLTVGDWDRIIAPITYTGDGALGVVGGSLSSTLLTAGAQSGIIYARETDNYAAVITDWECTLPAGNLVAYLPFDKSVTEDLCGGTWTVSGNPTIQDGALYVSGAAYVAKDGGCSLGGQDFTTSCFLKNGPNNNTNLLSVFYFSTRANDASSRINFYINPGGTLTLMSFNENYKQVSKSTWESKVTWDIDTDWAHVAVVYVHSTNTLTAYLNGVAVCSVVRNIPRTLFNVFNTGYNTRDKTAVNCYIKDWQVYDGVALWTEDFTPPAMSA